MHNAELMVNADLLRSAERHVLNRTNRRIRNLRLEARPEGVVVHGWTNSYHVEQLAILALREALAGIDPVPPLLLAIEVRRPTTGTMEARSGFRGVS